MSTSTQHRDKFRPDDDLAMLQMCCVSMGRVH